MQLVEELDSLPSQAVQSVLDYLLRGSEVTEHNTGESSSQTKPENNNYLELSQSLGQQLEHIRQVSHKNDINVIQNHCISLSFYI